MLLTKLMGLFRRVRDDERGAVMAAVIGLMMVGMLVTTLILSSVVTGLGSTTSTRAGVQSQAAAAAGVDVALAALTTGTSCSATYTSTTAPAYSASLSYTTASTISSSTAWIAGCPTASAQFVKITSVGTALSKGVAGNSTGNTKSIEAIYNRPVADPPISPSGPAIYAYSSQSYGGSGILVSRDGSNDANVMVKTGDVSCSGGAASQGDLVVNNGNLTISGSCGVLGNAWASGTGKGVVSLSGNVSVGGNVVGNSLSVNSSTVGGSTWTSGTTALGKAIIGGNVTVTAGDITSTNSNTIGKDTWSSGSTTVTNSDWVKGNATAQTLKITGGNIGSSASNSAWARGAATGTSAITAHLTAQSVSGVTSPQGGITVVPAGPGPGPAALPAPSAPTVPNWVNFAYNKSDWSGFSEYVLGSTSTCDLSALQTAVNSFAGSKGVIDARACSGGISMSGQISLVLGNDLAIISTAGFNISGSGFTTGGSAQYRLWLITPDTVVESPTAPSCPSGSSVSISGGAIFSSNISTIIYTPCTVSIAAGIYFYGQVFSGSASISGSAHFFYSPVGLPGYDMGTGDSTATPPPNPWSAVSTRNIGG
jgi:hypothetical protein